MNGTFDGTFYGQPWQVQNMAAAITQAAQANLYVGALGQQTMTEATKAMIAAQQAMQAAQDTAVTIGAAAAHLPTNLDANGVPIPTGVNTNTYIGTSVDRNATWDPGNPNSWAFRPIQINVSGNQFPMGMTPTQVAQSLSQQLFNQMGLMR
jgi:hypothetical protein